MMLTVLESGWRFRLLQQVKNNPKFQCKSKGEGYATIEDSKELAYSLSIQLTVSWLSSNPKRQVKEIDMHKQTQQGAWKSQQFHLLLHPDSKEFMMPILLLLHMDHKQSTAEIEEKKLWIELPDHDH